MLMPVVARANPYILNPSSLIAFGVVAFWALVVEAGLVALLLAFAGLAPLKVFVGFFVANVAVFLLVFCLLQQRIALPLLDLKQAHWEIAPRQAPKVSVSRTQNPVTRLYSRC